jgi:hypothetical protein
MSAAWRWQGNRSPRRLEDADCVSSGYIGDLGRPDLIYQHFIAESVIGRCEA